MSTSMSRDESTGAERRRPVAKAMDNAAIITLGHRRRTTLHTAGMRSRDSPRESLARSPASNLALSSAVEVASCPSAGALASSGRSRAARCGAPRGPTRRSRASAPSSSNAHTRDARAPRRKIRGRRWFARTARPPRRGHRRRYRHGCSRPAGRDRGARADGRRGSDREGAWMLATGSGSIACWRCGRGPVWWSTG